MLVNCDPQVAALQRRVRDLERVLDDAGRVLCCSATMRERAAVVARIAVVLRSRRSLRA